ncbi:MAG: hypothetical protein RL033_1710 [Pseudomonadota bacterium]|jgi:hypothetical protein
MGSVHPQRLGDDAATSLHGGALLLKELTNMLRSKTDDAPRALPGQEMTDEQLSLVLGAAGAPRTVLPRQAFGKSALLTRDRVPVINPERTLAPLYQGFDFAGIHPDLEDPFPKPDPNPPKEPPIPPDLEDPFPNPPPTDFPFPAAFER